MSVRSTSFRWSVGTHDACRAEVTDEIIEHPLRRPAVVLLNAARPVGDHVGAPKLKNQVLAMVAHELRGPLTPLQLATQLIRRASADRPEVLRSVDMIDRQIAQIARLAEDLMDATRIGRDALRMSQDHVDVVSFLAAPLAAAGLATAKRGQTFTVQIADRTLRVEGDPVRLAQAVNNLLHNAVKYTPESGIIAVNVLSDGKDFVVSVKDNGLGISAALLPHIFDLFAQSSRTIAASAGGLGVGLAVVKAIAESHGGSISATSAGAGAGSEFTLRLPIVIERRVAGERA
ncbi:sensor histidine kinase [Paraburkholderia saeva]|uniref:sensor histidine kinase n=1 Tax=Paraburkholderia saeva TaxID=2777537 RepID=UPI001E042DE0|nr:HAMP domain-containing sensor histidine kinase [Paraburkholderia saeva]CAG4911747.1 Alkaline phosphatase synthesis sensor protein PhoR [Paraburkholderia saeva]